MNEFNLSLGQVIDQLTPWEKAVCEEGYSVELHNGQFYLAEDDEPFTFHEEDRNVKWLIEPKLFTFKEALTAYYDGKFIESYLGGDLVEPWAGYHKDMDEPSISFREILEAKWVIRELEE